MGWFYKDGERKVGPFTEERLRESLERGGLPHDTPVWRDGMADWKAASEVLDLAPPEPDAWYYRAPAGGTIGPVTAGEVARHVLDGELDADSLVCHVGDMVWEPVSADRDLLDAIAELRHERKLHPAPARPPRPAPEAPAGVTPGEAAKPASAPSAAPHADWYQRALGGEKGPFTLQQMEYRVKQGALKRDDLVRGPGHPDWVHAADAPELGDAFHA
jgi:hypothetical protein